MRPSSSCVCKYINSIQTNTRFVILMHPMEYRKEKNGTGNMTKLQLKNSEIIVGVDFTKHKRVNEILADKKNDSFLLYPGKENFNLSLKNHKETKAFVGETPYLFILDGTWPCARKMLKLSSNLQKLKRVSFANEIKSKFIIKQQPNSLCLSTIESVYTVLNILNAANVEQCNTKNFLLPFEKMIAYQVACILNPENNNHSYEAVNKGITLKNMYKKKSQRGIIFEK